MNYMISYDLNNKGKNYDGLAESIKRISGDAWCKPCESTYVIKCSLPNSKAVYDALSSEIDADDHMIVASVTSDMCVKSYEQAAKYLADFAKYRP